MIRLTVLLFGLLAVWVYAFRDWMVAMCGLILLTFLVQNKSMPSSVGGIPGVNPWNLTLAVVTVGWLVQRKNEGRSWKPSRVASAVVAGYIGIIILAYAQAMQNTASFPSDFQENLTKFLTVDHLINPLKYLWAAFLFADGCNSERRLQLALGTLAGLGIFYAVMVIKVIPLASLVDGAGILAYRGRIEKQVGLNANDMAKVLALTLWSIWAIQRLWWRDWWSKGVVLAAYPVTFLGLALCYSRAGYLTFVAIGIVLGCVRWRKLLLLVPTATLLVAMFMPGVTERVLMGFESDRQVGGTPSTDWNEVTAGRTGNLWPPIIEEIQNAPFLGHGRLAILHTPAYDKIQATEGAVPTTPHNGYLEVMVDTGAVGLAIVLWVFLGSGVLSYRLLRRHDDSLATAVGTLGLVHSVGCLVNALSGGILLPSQGMLGTFCAFGMVLRAWYGRLPATVTPAVQSHGGTSPLTVAWEAPKPSYPWWQRSP